MISNFSVLLPVFQLLPYLPFVFSTEQNVLKDTVTSPFNSDFERLVRETLKLWHVPGVAIAVVDGEHKWSEGYGIATYPSTPVTPSTLFYCGSTTKAFTSAAMSLLVADSNNYSHVQWNTPISSLIREDFVLEDEYATSHITIEDALSHRTGMPRHDFSYGENYDGHKGQPKDLVRQLRYLPLTAEPRTKWQYCNMMFITASHVIEALTGKWLGDYLKEKIWTPLEMKSTYFSNTAAQNAPEHLAMGYVYYDEEFHEVSYDDLDIISGAGSVISNVLDYSKWIHALLHSSPPLPPSTYIALKSPRMLIGKENEPDPSPYTGSLSYSLGWRHGVYKGYEFFEHTGGMEAFGAHVIFFPALDYGVVALGNTAVTSNAVEERLIYHLIDEKIGIPEKERFDWNKKNHDSLQKSKDEYKNAREIYYPTAPNPPLPLTLPLQNYTGTYFNPGYRNISIFHKEDALHIIRGDSTLKLLLDFKHVSGDYFVAYVDSTAAPGSIFKAAIPAEFKVGSDGVARTVGINVEPEMGLEGRIWFERV